MLFESRFRDGIVDDSVTLTFRRWKRRQAVVGHRYRTLAGIIEVDSVDLVDPAAISEAEALRSGYPSARALRGDLRGSPQYPVYRVSFHYVGADDPRDRLAASADLAPEDIAALDRRLARLDSATPNGPWAFATLEAIGANPGLRAADLAVLLGRDRDSLKVDVRKLKNLGLTLSLEVGYRLSPRGEAYLRSRS